MKYEEKINLIISAIREANKIKLEHHYTQLYPPSELSIYEIYDFLRLFENERAIQIIPSPKIDDKNTDNSAPINNVILLEVMDNFEEWAKKKIESLNSDYKVHWISFNYSDGKLLLDDKYPMRKLNYDGENHAVFNFLYKNPNIAFTNKQIEHEIEVDINKSLHKIVENLGFKNELRKMFFSVGKDKICFHNPVGSDRIKQLGLENFVIPEDFKF